MSHGYDVLEGEIRSHEPGEGWHAALRSPIRAESRQRPAPGGGVRDGSSVLRNGALTSDWSQYNRSPRLCHELRGPAPAERSGQH